MNISKKIVGFNLLLLLLYNVFLHSMYGNDSSSIFEGLTWLISIHVIVNLILAVVYTVSKEETKSDLSTSFYLSFVLVLLIGFSTCFGSLDLK